MGVKNFKELEIILSDFACDKQCPYCTAKITRWPKVKDDIHMLELNVGQMKELGYSFHYVTIGGNGEPTLHSYEKIKDIVEMFDGWNIPVKRVLTSGNVFRPQEKDKYDLFISHGWMFEVTATSADMEPSNRIQGYDWDYMQTDAFKQARVRLNYVLLEENYPDKFLSDIEYLSSNYQNIETLALKLLNPNTREDGLDNPLSSWIIDNAVPKDKRQEIADILNSHYKYVGEAYDTHSWEMENGAEVYFSWKKVEYGLYDLVWYGDKFIDYHLNPVDIGLLPKIYIAARFMKQKAETGFSFAEDFRAKLIGTEKDFVDFNNHSFIRGINGRYLAQYLGPFYNEKASDGTLTSTACEEVVRTENSLIEKCDVFIAYLDEILSPGGINELTYATLLGKKIIIFYKVEPDVEYSTQTSSWYPITFAQLLSDKCIVEPVSDVSDVMNRIPEILESI